MLLYFDGGKRKVSLVHTASRVAFVEPTAAPPPLHLIADMDKRRSLARGNLPARRALRHLEAESRDNEGKCLPCFTIISTTRLARIRITGTENTYFCGYSMPLCSMPSASASSSRWTLSACRVSTSRRDSIFK